MSLERYLLAFRQRWLVVVLGAALGLACGLGAFLLIPTEFTATTSLYISAQPTATTAEAFQGAQLAQQQAQSYTELSASSRVTEQVVKQLGLPISPDAVAERVSATNRANSSVITISATDGSPAVATSMANATAEALVSLVADLERPTNNAGIAPVALRVVQSASPPVAPSSLGLVDILAIGLFVGLAVGSAVAVATNARRTPVSSPAQLAELTDVPVLGVYNDDAPRSHSRTLRRPRWAAPSAEVSRRLRTNLAFAGGVVPPRVIAVASSLPQEGTTTTVVNLAAAFSSTGSRVVVVEANLRSPSLARLLDLHDDVPGLSDTLAGHAEPENVIQRWNDTFDVVPAGWSPPNAGELVTGDRLRPVLDSLRKTYDYVLLDCPPLLPVADTASIVPITDGAVVLCRYGTVDETQIVSAMDTLDAVSGRVLGAVLTMARGGGKVAPAFDLGRRHQQHTASHEARTSELAPPDREPARASYADASVPDRSSVAASGVDR